MADKMKDKLSKMNDTQKKIHDIVVNKGESVFFTGDAGTGKSFLLDCIVHSLNAGGMGKKRIAITASTGKAAYNISGCTLHSFAGVGLGEKTANEYIARILRSDKLKKKWRGTSVLIIDEVSMVTEEFFDKIEEIARNVVNKDLPFGGIQLIVVGDLMQLGPVNTGSDIKKGAFESKSWSKCIKDENYFALSKIHRQSDVEFITVLKLIRLGIVDDKVIEFMEKLSKPKTYEEGVKVTHLYGLRRLADDHNYQELQSLDGASVSFMSMDRLSDNSNRKMLDQCPAPAELELKIGCQVMLIKNITKNLVNGTVGVVVDIVDVMNGESLKAINKTKGSDSSTIQKIVEEKLKNAVPVVKFTMLDGKVFRRPMQREEWKTESPDGKLISSRSQIPLILAWATTIHKSQGQTIQRLKVDLGNIFEHGQAYTAISRAVSPEGLEVTGFTPECITANKSAAEFCIKHNLL